MYDIQREVLGLQELEENFETVGELASSTPIVLTIKKSSATCGNIAGGAVTGLLQSFHSFIC